MNIAATTRRLLPLLFLLALMATACRHDERPADVLDAPAMVNFLADAYMLEGFYAVESQYRYDALTPEVLSAYDDILARHHTTREAVEHSFDYYAAHPDIYQPILDSVLARLEGSSSADTAVALSSAPKLNL